MKAAILIAASLCLTTAAAARDTYVKPHVRSDGTYVQGHYRTAPNRTPSDNYSPYQYKPQTYTPPPPPKPLYGYKPRGY